MSEETDTRERKLHVALPARASTHCGHPFHQQRIDSTANAAVSWSVPTFTYRRWPPRHRPRRGSPCPVPCHEVVRAHGHRAALGSVLPPAVGRSPRTDSFFLVSTLITGSPATWQARACSLMYRNCASRSGCRGLFFGKP